MRGSELLDKLELVDPAYVEAADRVPVKPPRRPKWKYAAAACLCLALAGAFLGGPAPADAFTVKAYALECGEDGGVRLAETDLLERQEILGGRFDGENFYLNIGLRAEGQNIDHVAFTAKEGFFATQRVGDLTSGKNVSKLYVGPENRLAVYGREFKAAGSEITLDGGTEAEDLLLFWGIRVPDAGSLPQQAEIKAVVTFRDGKTEETSVTIPLRGQVMVYTETIDEEALRLAREEFDYYQSLPLEDCELLEDTMETVTEVYECAVGYGVTYHRDFDKMPFDGDGLFRAGVSHDGDIIYLTVIRRNGDGTYTGMVYRVPPALEYGPEG